MDAVGTLYFVDTHWQRVYKWDAQNREAVTMSIDPLQPENLAFDKVGDLLVVSRSGAGKVYALRPDGTTGEIKMIQQQPALDRGDAVEYLAGGVYGLRQFSSERA